VVVEPRGDQSANLDAGGPAVPGAGTGDIAFHQAEGDPNHCVTRQDPGQIRQADAKVKRSYRRVSTGGGVVPGPWLSADAIATHLGVTKDTVYDWIAVKQMPAHRAGRL
jgi:excisionase family DNA binding protein